MAGARMGDHWQVLYPVSELAVRYGASAKRRRPTPGQAYVGFEPSRRERPSVLGPPPLGLAERFGSLGGCKH